MSRGWEVISRLFQKFANITESQGQNLWGLSNSIEIPSISLPNIEVSSKSVNKAFLAKRLSAAAGPSRMVNGTSTSNEEPKNPQWPSSNQNWSGHFGNIAADAISSAVNTVLKEQNNSIKGVKDQINSSLQAIEPYIEKIGQFFLKSAEASNKRGQLIWWKEALHSTILNKSYREIPPIITALIMAIDLSDMIPSVYPVSVDYLLRESLTSVHNENVNKEYSLIDLLDQLVQIEEEEKKLINKRLYKKTEGRKSLGNLIANKLSDSPINFIEEIGIEKDTKIALGDFSVWFFNDLQAEKLVSIK